MMFFQGTWLNRATIKRKLTLETMKMLYMMFFHGTGLTRSAVEKDCISLFTRLLSLSIHPFFSLFFFLFSSISLCLNVYILTYPTSFYLPNASLSRFLQIKVQLRHAFQAYFQLNMALRRTNWWTPMVHEPV